MVVRSGAVKPIKHTVPLDRATLDDERKCREACGKVRIPVRLADVAGVRGRHPHDLAQETPINPFRNSIGALYEFN